MLNDQASVREPSPTMRRQVRRAGFLRSVGPQEGIIGTAERETAEGNRATSRRTKDVDMEPGEQDATLSVYTATAMPEGSCADLTEDTAAESDSEAECAAQPEEGTAMARHGPLRTPTPPQVVMAAARARAKKTKRKRRSNEEGQTTRGTKVEVCDSSSNSSLLDSSSNSSSKAVAR